MHIHLMDASDKLMRDLANSIGIDTLLSHACVARLHMTSTVEREIREQAC